MPSFRATALSFRPEPALPSPDLSRLPSISLAVGRSILAPIPVNAAPGPPPLTPGIESNTTQLGRAESNLSNNTHQARESTAAGKRRAVSPPSSPEFRAVLVSSPPPRSRTRCVEQDQGNATGGPSSQRYELPTREFDERVEEPVSFDWSLDDDVLELGGEVPLSEFALSAEPNEPVTVSRDTSAALLNPELYLLELAESTANGLVSDFHNFGRPLDEPGTWRPPKDAETLNRKQVLPLDLERAAGGDIVVDAGPEFPTYSVATIPDDDIRLSSAYAKTVDRVDLMVMLAPSGYEGGKWFDLENRWNALNTVINSVQRDVLESNATLIVRYLEWCERNRIAPRERFPADPKTVLRWVAELGSGKWSPSYVRKHFNAVEMWHQVHFLPLDVDDKIKSRVLKGATRLAPMAREERRGITISDIVCVIEYFRGEANKDPKLGHRNLALVAAILMLFFGMGRSKDACLDRRTPFKRSTKKRRNTRASTQRLGRSPSDTHKTQTFDPKYDMTGASFTFHPATDELPAIVTAQLPFDKAKHRKGAKLQMAEQTAIDVDLDPVRAVANHLRANQPTANDPAFSFIGADGKTRVWLTKSFFRRKINEALEADGREKIHLHSFRIGGANFYVMAGANAEIVRAMGRWASFDVFTRYLRHKTVYARKFLANIALGAPAEEEEEDEEDVDDVPDITT
ncbi:hypothetical protein JCM1841_002673 [Sporobolomyces salmonicolor]